MERRHGTGEQGTRPRAGSERRQERREGWRAGGLKALGSRGERWLFVICSAKRKKSQAQVRQSKSRAVLQARYRYPSGKLPQNEAGAAAESRGTCGSCPTLCGGRHSIPCRAFGTYERSTGTASLHVWYYCCAAQTCDLAVGPSQDQHRGKNSATASGSSLPAPGAASYRYVYKAHDDL